MYIKVEKSYLTKKGDYIIYSVSSALNIFEACLVRHHSDPALFASNQQFLT